jgi:hypothetical protein
MPVAELVHVTFHATPKLVDVPMKAFPGGLAANADRSADHFPRRSRCRGLADKLDVPRGKKTDECAGRS